MVSSSSVYPFQTGSPVVEWVSHAAHGLGLDCGAVLEKQLGGGGISRRQYLGQRLDRISKLGHLGATESVCLYDLCQNRDRFANLGVQRGQRGPGGILVKMQTLDDMVTDFVPPLTDTYRRVYEVQYLYRPRPSIKVTEAFAEPTIPVCLPADDVDTAPKNAKAHDDDDHNKAVSSPS